MPVEFNWSDPGAIEFLIICFNVGNFLAVVAFMVRGAISLRMLTVIGALLQALFYAFVAQDIITYGLFWKSLTAVIAFAVVLVIVRERMGRQFAPELRGLAQELRLLNPGQIEKLFRVGDIRVADGERCIISQGARPDELFYLLEGSATVLKDGRPIAVEAGTFLGEIAFVGGGNATADVLVTAGSRYVAWPVDRLNALLAKDDQIDIALRGLINHDLARKVAAQPVSAPKVLKTAAE
jgi:CRP-like cAMP-binding protein